MIIRLSRLYLQIIQDNPIIKIILSNSTDSQIIEIILLEHFIHSLLNGCIVISGSRKFLLTLRTIAPISTNYFFGEFINGLFAILGNFYSFTDRTIGRI